MKKKNYLVLPLAVFFITLASCQSDNNEGGEQLAQAKPVVFNDVADEVIDSEPTGNVINGNKRELREVVRKQMTLKSAQLVDESKADVIYPGCLLRGDAFMAGEYTPVVIKNPSSITLSATLRGKGLDVTKTTMPTLSAVRQAINDLVYPRIGEINFEGASSYITYNSDEVTTNESFNKVFQVHADANVLAGLIKSNFKYETRKFSSRNKHYVLVKARQQFFNISVDPKAADDWGNLENIGEYEPVYVSSVDYGRVVNFLVETTESADSIRKMVEGGIEVAFKKIGGKVETSYSKQWNHYLKEEKMQVMIAGGPLEYAKKHRSYNDIMNFLDVPGSRSLIESCVPIGYRVRSVKTNREIAVKSFYTEERLVPEK